MADKEKVFQSLLEIVSCPVCFERLRPKASCCINGHAVCGKCKKSLTNCPICSSKFSREKHTILQQVLEALPSKCRFKGCMEWSTDIEEHEMWCGFRSTECRKCRWEGAAKKIRSHVESKHIVTSESDCFQNINEKSFMFVNAKVLLNQFFWESRIYESENKKFSVQLIWIPDGTKKEDAFRMNIEFQSKESTLSASTRIRLCAGDSEDLNSLMFHMDMLKPFTDEYKHISYTLFVSEEVCPNKGEQSRLYRPSVKHLEGGTANSDNEVFFDDSDDEDYEGLFTTASSKFCEN